MSAFLRIVTGDQLSAQELYAILQLREEVFAIEQQTIYVDLDGHDLKPTTQHFWLAESDGKLLSYLRLFIESDGVTIRVGRVVTRAAVRNRGLSRQLLTAAIAEIGNRPSVLNAQAYAVDLYGSFGYTPTSPEFIEKGVLHVHMRRN